METTSPEAMLAAERAVKEHQYAMVKEELRNDATAIRSAVRYIIASETGTLPATSFHQQSYQEVVSILDELGEEGVVPADWRSLGQEISPASKETIQEDHTNRDALLQKEPKDVPAGRLEGADASWAEREHAVSDFKSITQMSWEGLRSKETVGSVSPAVPSASFITGIRLPTPEGSHKITLTQKDLKSTLARDIPSVEDEEAYTPKEGDVTIKIRAKGKFAETFPCPMGADVVASLDEEGMLVARDPRTPLIVQNLDVPDIRGFVLRPRGESQGIPIERKNFEPTAAEQTYWSKVMPLPDHVRAYCEEHRDEIPRVIGEFVKARFTYVCHDGYGAFLEEHQTDLPLIVDELRMGHCDILSWASAAYFRQLGVPCFLTTERVTDQEGKGFRAKSGHARTAIIDKENDIAIFDPARICAAPTALSPDHLSTHYFDQLSDLYAKAITEQEKRQILRLFLRAIKPQVLETEKRLAMSSPHSTNIHDLLTINEGDQDTSLEISPAETVRFAERDVTQEGGEAYTEKATDVASWVQYIEKMIQKSGEEHQLDELTLRDGFASIEKKKDRVLIAEAIGAYAEARIPPLNQVWGGHYDALLESEGFNNYDIAAVGTPGYLFQYFSDNKILRKVSEQRWKELQKIFSSPTAFAKQCKILDCEETSSRRGETGYYKIELENASLSFLPGVEKFPFSKNFKATVDRAKQSDGFFTNLANQFGHEKKSVSAAEYLVFMQLATRAMIDPAIRAYLATTLNLTDECLRDIASSLQPTMNGRPKRVLRGTSGQGTFTRDANISTAARTFDFQALEKVLYIPRDERRKAHSASKKYFDKLMKPSRRQSEREVEGLEEYSPYVHDVRDISWPATARSDRPIAKKYAPEKRSDEPIFVMFDDSGLMYKDIDRAYSIRPTVHIMLTALGELQRRKGTPIFVTGSRHDHYMEFDVLHHRPDLFATLLTAGGDKKDHEPSGLQTQTPEKRIELPKNLVYISPHEGKVAAVKYQLGSRVHASTYADIGCDVYARIKPEWVEEGKDEVSF